MPYINYNEKILEESTAITGPDNRGMRYGDGLFETIKYKDGRLILFDEHLARLWKGMQLMQFKIPKLFTPDLLQKETMQLLKKNKLDSSRIRITVIRGDGGLYDTKSHLPEYIIQCGKLADNTSTLNENGLQLCIYRDAKKSIDCFSNIKHNNFLPYFMGALFAKENLCNDAVILNSAGRISDSSIANIFIVKDSIMFTPPLSEGCIAGVMRKFILEQLSVLGYQVNEIPVTEEMLMNADECFLTNSIYNIRWVAGLAGKKYSNDKIKEIYQLLARTNKEVFC